MDGLIFLWTHIQRNKRLRRYIGVPKENPHPYRGSAGLFLDVPPNLQLARQLEAIEGMHLHWPRMVADRIF